MTSTATSTTPAATTTETNKNEIISSMLSNDVLSQTDSSSRSSIITIQKLRQLFPGLWSFRPGKTAATTTMQDTNGFSFQLTERTGQRETYSGLLQIHAHTDPQWLIIDISNKDITYQFKATKGYSRLRVDVRKDKFCFSLKFMPKDSALLERVSEFSTLLLEGKQSIYSFTQTSAKYDSAINTLCTSANNVSRIDGFLIGDESFVSCAKKPAGQQNFSPHIFITRNLVIKVGLQMGKGKFITASKRCILLDKFDTKLADALGNRYFAEILSDSMDNKRSIERGYIRPTFWFETKSEACVIPYMADAAKCASYLSSSTAKPTKTCIFVHGAGGSSDQAPRSTFSDYWGDIENWTPQCKKRVFAVRDTLNVGWDDAKLQKYYCDLAVKESGYNVTVRGVPYLKNVVIFSHSQGGLVISAALNNRKCALDSTSSWYSVSTPFEGSEVVDKMVNYCASFKSGANVLSKDYVYGYLATKFGYCDPATGKPYPGYFSISKNYSKNGVTTTQLYTSNTSRSYRPAGRMCGTSPIGIISKYSILLTVLSGSTDLSNPNDGMLENSSCTSVCTQTFNSLYTSNFYTANINHADTSCRNGNGWYSRSKQPCLYYKDKV